jgi:hypothetical protein
VNANELLELIFSSVGQVGNLQRVGNPLGRVETEGRRLPTGAQDAILPTSQRRRQSGYWLLAT